MEERGDGGGGVRQEKGVAVEKYYEVHKICYA